MVQVAVCPDHRCCIVVVDHARLRPEACKGEGAEHGGADFFFFFSSCGAYRCRAPSTAPQHCLRMCVGARTACWHCLLALQRRVAAAGKAAAAGEPARVEAAGAKGKGKGRGKTQGNQQARCVGVCHGRG